MRTLFTKHLFLILTAVLLSIGLSAQTRYTIPAGAEVSVDGTSSLHDWTMTSKSATGTAEIVMENGELKSIQNLSVNVKAETLKSGKGGMDDNAYKALNTKKNPDIKFTLDKINSIEKKGDHYLISASGKMTIGAQTKAISVQSKAVPQGQALNVTGSKTFKMTEYGVTPPTALMGTIKTGDQITINYNLIFK